MLRWILLLSLLVFQTACDSPNNNERPSASLLQPASQAQEDTVVESPVFEALVATDLLNEPTPVYRFETTAEALSVWRRAPVRPTLLLLSNNPHLTPIPEELRNKTAILINNANLETLAMATSDRNPAPLILPGMAIDAALRSDWFSELAWALPIRDPAVDLSMEKFNKQLSESQLANEEEIASMQMEERVIHGSLRNTAFTSAALPLLQNLSQPVIIHIDLSYFQPLYKNEIATPLLDIIFNTLSTLRKMHLKTLAVTFSYGHLDSQIGLDVRFLGDIVSALIEDPTLMDQPIPLNWQRQRDSLYLANFFQKEKVQELFEAQEKDAADVAWVKFNLYRSAAENKQGTKALAYLAEAVSLDSMYATEYSELSNLAYEKQRPDESLRMLSLASDVFPNDPYLKLRMAQLANELGQKEMALELINKIRNLAWSEIYYPQMPQYLADLTRFIQTGEIPQESTSTNAGSNENSMKEATQETNSPRQKVLHTN